MVYFNSSSGIKTVIDAREVAPTNIFENQNNFSQFFAIPGQINGLRYFWLFLKFLKNVAVYIYMFFQYCRSFIKAVAILNKYILREV